MVTILRLLPLLSTAYLDLDVAGRPVQPYKPDSWLDLRSNDVVPRYDKVLDSYSRPWEELLTRRMVGSCDDSRISVDNGTFRVTLDVRQFKPDEVSVKV